MAQMKQGVGYIRYVFETTPDNFRQTEGHIRHLFKQVGDKGLRNANLAIATYDGEDRPQGDSTKGDPTYNPSEAMRHLMAIEFTDDDDEPGAVAG